MDHLKYQLEYEERKLWDALVTALAVDDSIRTVDHVLEWANIIVNARQKRYTSGDK